MRSRLICFLFFVFLLTSCIDKNIVVPEEIIQRDKMVLILTDMQMVEALLQKDLIKAENTAKESAGFYLEIYTKHGISKEEFENSFLFYKSQPKLLEEVYDDVINELVSRQAELKKDAATE